MKQRIKSALLITFGYFLIANLGNLFFHVSGDIVTTLWESFFFFLFIFLLLGYRNNDKK